MSIRQVVFFSRHDSVNGAELWATDGSVTWLVKDINAGVGGSNPRAITTVGNELYFSAYDSTDGYQLWKSDGTDAGTQKLTNIYPSRNAQKSITDVNGTAFFAASDPNQGGTQLWKSDGSVAGTVRVTNLSLPNGMLPEDMTVVGSTLFFEGVSGSLGERLWKSGGTSATTVSLTPDMSARGISDLIEFNGQLYFVTGDNSSDYEIWSSDGNTAQPVTNLPDGGTRPAQLTPIDDDLFFSFRDQVWKWNAQAGAERVSPVVLSGPPLNPLKLVNVNGTLFFIGHDDLHGTQLWKSDGTTAGTVRITDINPAQGGLLIQDDAEVTFLAVGDTLYFVGSNGFDGQQLWKSDGTAAGTSMVTQGSMFDYQVPFNLTNVDGTLYFQAAEDWEPGNTIMALWKTDGTLGGTTKVASYIAAEPIAYISVSTDGVVITGSASSDTIDLSHTVDGQPLPTQLDDTISGRGGSDSISSLGGNDKVSGDAGDDFLNGGAGNDVLNGGAGADHMDGGDGDDRYYIDNAGDTVTDLSGLDSIYTTIDYSLGAAFERLYARSDAGLTLNGNGADNVIAGRGGDDTLNGGDGDDVLNGGAGADHMDGGDGDDRYYIDNAGDTVTDLSGLDSIYAMVDYSLGTGVERLYAKSDAGLTLNGNGADNTIVGRGGNDIITGGGGRDIMSGGAGADQFVFQALSDSPASGQRDVIRDFLAGTDKIDLTAIDANTALANDQTFMFIGAGVFTHTAGELQAKASGANTLISGDVDGNGHVDFQILLSGHIALQATDFLL